MMKQDTAGRNGDEIRMRAQACKDHPNHEHYPMLYYSGIPRLEDRPCCSAPHTSTANREPDRIPHASLQNFILSLYTSCTGAS